MFLDVPSLDLYKNTLSEIVLSGKYFWLMNALFIVNGCLEILLLQFFVLYFRVKTIDRYLILLPGFCTFFLGVFNCVDFYVLHLVAGFGFVFVWVYFELFVSKLFLNRGFRIYTLVQLLIQILCCFGAVLYFGRVNAILEICYLVFSVSWIATMLFVWSKMVTKN
jgi:hypothetical protein